MKKIVFIPSFVLAVVWSGCVSMDMSTARSVTVKPSKGGIVTLNPPQDPKAREKAVAIMKQTCGAKNYEVTEEGEAVVGSKAVANEQRDKPVMGATGIPGLSFGTGQKSTQTETEQRQVTEWRITYECK